jgi:hypothetical protein
LEAFEQRNAFLEKRVNDLAILESNLNNVFNDFRGKKVIGYN